MNNPQVNINIASSFSTIIQLNPMSASTYKIKERANIREEKLVRSNSITQLNASAENFQKDFALRSGIIKFKFVTQPLIFVYLFGRPRILFFISCNAIKL